jgi:HK97 family phage portal protein
MNPLKRFGAAAKAFAMTFVSGSGRWWWSTLGRTRFDYAREVGTGRGNAAVMACVLWFCRTFPEAPLRVSTLDRKGQPQPDEQHPLKQLLDTPNPYYSGELLWYGTLADWMLTGNAYWLKVRSGAGRVIELWWVPSTMIEPKWPDDGSAYLSHYDYTPNAKPIRVETADVVHFRYGLDPQNTRKGLSPLASLFREVFTDDEAANYTASMLRNVGVPPVVISPELDKDGNGPKMDQAGADEVKGRFQDLSTGDERGKAIVMRGATKITTLGFKPSDMDTKSSRRIPEERISAIFGTPAVVVGLGAGLDRSTFANFSEAREAAYESNVIPSQRLLAGELRTQLLPDFGDRAKLRIDFDLSEVRVLQTDQNALHQRAREDLKAGLLSRNQALEVIGEEPDPSGDVIYVPIGVTVTPADALTEQPLPAPAPDPAAALPPGAPPPKWLPTLYQQRKERDLQRRRIGDAPDDPAERWLLRNMGWDVFDHGVYLKSVPRSLPTGRKAADGVGDAVQRLRTRLEGPARREVARVLQGQQNRVVERLNGTSKAAGDVPSPEDLLPPDEQEQLRKALEVIHLRSLQGVHALAEDVLGIAFDLDDPTTRAFLVDAGANIVGIHQTTLDAVRAALLEGQAAGEGIGELAARIRDLPAFDQARATLVARTELGQATNRAAVYSYRASGVVVGVQIADGDADEACAAMNGRTFALDKAPAPLQHPNCTRAFLPLTDATQLENAA